MTATTSNTLERAKHKLKQIKEAISLIEDIEWKICWALDFSEYQSINELLSPIAEQASTSLEEMQEMEESLEEEIEAHEFRKKEHEEEFENETNLKYYLD
jgi:hypothetical protein